MVHTTALDGGFGLQETKLLRPERADDGVRASAISRHQPKISAFSDVDHLPVSAKALLAEEEDRRFFNGLSWYRVFCETCLDPGQQPIFYVVTLDRSDQRQLILPMLSPLGREGSKVSSQQLAPETCMSMTNYQSAYFGPITNAADDDLAMLLEGLARHLKDQHVAVVDFNHLDSGIPENAELLSAFERAGFVAYSYPDEPIVVENLTGLSYQNYMASRSSRLRQNIWRLRKKLAKVGEVRFTLFDGDNRLPEAIRDYEVVQKASWKPDETYQRHVPSLIRAAADRNTLRLGLLYLDNRPVAADLIILSNGHATGKKADFCEEMRNHHVGDVLTSYLIEHLLDKDQINSIDFGKTAISYKRKWLRQQRPMSGFVAFDPGSLQGQWQRFRFRSKQIAWSQISAIKRDAHSFLIERIMARTASS